MAIAFAVFHEIGREAKPSAGATKCDLVCADLDYCMVAAVKSVDSGVRTEQRCPGGPKFGSEARIEHQRLAVDLAEDDIYGTDDCDDVGDQSAFAHHFERLQRGEAGV